MPPKQPSDRLPKRGNTTLEQDLDALAGRWAETRRNQIAVIERLQGIIDLVGEVTDDPSLSPDQKVQKIQEILP